MPLSFFPAYCGIVLLAAAAVQKFFVVSDGDYLVSQVQEAAVAGSTPIRC
jgi:hypothetical protein